MGLPIVEDACEALGAVHADGVAGRRARPSGGVRLLRQQAADDRRGRHGHHRRRGGQGAHRLRAQPGPRARTWTGSTTTASGFNYRLVDVACAIGLAQLDRLDGMLAGRARAAGWYREALAGHRGARSCPARTRGGDRRGWFVFVVQLPRGRDRDARDRALRERGVQSKPYLPAIHLMSYYRETFGHREGEFPVCEDVAARSIALPFFPADRRQSQVEQVGDRAARGA